MASEEQLDRRRLVRLRDDEPGALRIALERRRGAQSAGDAGERGRALRPELGLENAPIGLQAARRRRMSARSSASAK
jgi:hypothetical protein